MLSPNDAHEAWLVRYIERLTAATKLLLEARHLYQSAVVEIEDVTRELEAKIVPEFRPLFSVQVRKTFETNWAVHDNANPPPVAMVGYGITLHVPDVKLFCRHCDRLEAFNSVSTEEFTHHGSRKDHFGTDHQIVQVFVLSFLCQSCKVVPEVFLVNRRGPKLTLCGRAPMEEALVPPVIPKSIRQHFAGALVAHQSGQTLAGLFLLRTLIEQWARSQLEKAPNQADQVMDQYMATLPDDFNDRFPSMRSLYGEVSADLHSAIGRSHSSEWRDIRDFVVSSRRPPLARTLLAGAEPSPPMAILGVP